MGLKFQVMHFFRQFIGIAIFNLPLRRLRLPIGDGPGAGQIAGLVGLLRGEHPQLHVGAVLVVGLQGSVGRGTERGMGHHIRGTTQRQIGRVGRHRDGARRDSCARTVCRLTVVLEIG